MTEYGRTVNWRWTFAAALWVAFLLPVWSASARGADDAEPTAVPGLAVLDADPRPAEGEEIRRVVADSQATRLGIEVGDVIVAINDVPLTGEATCSAVLERAEQRQLRVVDTDGHERLVAVKPGIIGIQHRQRERLRLSVSRAMKRDAKWNGAMLSAAQAIAQARWQAAASHLESAAAAGYPMDGVFRGLAWHVAMGRGDYAVAAELLGQLPAHQLGRVYLPDVDDLYRFYLATSQTEAMDRLVTNHPLDFPFAETAAWQDWIQRVRPMRHLPPVIPPMDRTAHRIREVVNGQLTRTNRWPWGGEPRIHDGSVIANRSFLMHSPPGHFNQAFVTREEDFGDFSVDAKFRIKPLGDHRKWATILSIHVANFDLDINKQNVVQRYWNGEAILLGARFEASDDGPLLVLAHGWLGPTRDMSRDFMDGQGWHTLRLTRVGDRGQIVVDGVVVAELPVDPDVGNLLFHIHSVGLQVEMETYEIAELTRDPAWQDLALR